MRCQLASGANWDVTDRYDGAQPCNDLFTVLSVCQCFLPTLCRSPSMRWQWKTCLRVTTCTPAPSVSAKYEQRNGKTSPTVWTATSGGLWKSDEPISLKLGVMIGPASRKKLFTFGGAPIPDTDSGSIFHFTHHCGIGNFRRFISISHTVGAWFLRDLAKWMVMNPQYFGRDPADIRTRSGLESCITFGWNFGIVWGLDSVSKSRCTCICLRFVIVYLQNTCTMHLLSIKMRHIYPGWHGMGNHLHVSKLAWYVTSHPGQFCFSVVRRNE